MASESIGGGGDAAAPSQLPVLSLRNVTKTFGAIRALEDVSIDIRRTGLDLDPDWVPWLGVVLRFVYA